MSDEDLLTKISKLLANANLDLIEITENEVVIDGILLLRTIDQNGVIHVYDMHTGNLHWTAKLGLLRGAMEMILHDLRQIPK